MNRAPEPLLIDPEQEHYDDDEALDLRYRWHVIWNRKWPILGLVILSGLLAALVAFGLQPTYKSEATLLMTGGNPPVVATSQDQYGSWLMSRDFQNTQYEILKSQQLAKATLERLELDKHPEFDPLQRKKTSRFNIQFKWPEVPSTWRQWFPKSWFQPDNEETQSTLVAIPEKALIDWLQDRLSVDPLRDTQLVRVGFEAHDPKLAAFVANTYAQAYIENNMEGRLESLQQASVWLTDRLDVLREKVRESETKLQNYREEIGIVNVDGMQSIYAEQLKDLTNKVIDARKQRAIAQNLNRQIRRLESAQSGGLDSFTTVSQHPVMQGLKTQEAEAERSIAELSKRYGPAHPKMIAARTNLTTIQSKITESIGRVAQGVGRDYEVARAYELALEKELANLEAKVQGANRKEFQLSALEQEVESNRQFYDVFLNRLKEMSATSDDTISVVARVVDAAEPDASPFKPNRQRIIAIAMVLALFAGIGLAFLLEKLDNTLKTREDVEVKLKVPVLGVIEKMPKKLGKGRHLIPERVCLDENKSLYAEEIRTLRTGVLMSGLDKAHKTVIVTSTVTGEGKTTVAMNLAFALGQLENVLLIDCDLRRPSIGKLCGLDEDTPGLSTLVAGTPEPAKCIHRLEDAKIDVIPAGPLVPNPLEILSSVRFSKILHNLSEAYTWIVLDSTPIQLVSDAIVLSARADSFVYVAKADDTPYQVVREGLGAMLQGGAPIIGAVLNQRDTRNTSKYGYRGKYYGYSTYGYPSN